MLIHSIQRMLLIDIITHMRDDAFNDSALVRHVLYHGNHGVIHCPDQSRSKNNGYISCIHLPKEDLNRDLHILWIFTRIEECTLTSQCET